MPRPTDVVRPRILLTLPDVAWPLDGGKRLRCAAVLRGLSEVGDVDVAFLFSTAPQGVAPVPPDVGVRRWTRLSPPALPTARGALAALSRRLPMHVAAQRWDVVRAELSAWRRDDYDLVWFGGLDHAAALREDLPGAVRVVDCDDVETEKWRAFLSSGAAGGTGAVERLQRRAELPMWQRIQDEVGGWADAVVVCSDIDQVRLGGARTAVVPNTYPEPDGPAPWDPPEQPRVVMVANYGTAQNVDAARAAALGVLPRLRDLVPGARLRLVGRGADTLTDLVGTPGLDLVGPVDGVDEELAGATAVVVPMRFGGGTRLKVLEAFAHGVPVVSTSLGCEGVGVVDGVHALVRDDPAGLAAACLEVHVDRAAAAHRARAARTLYEEHFRPAASTAAVVQLVRPLLDDPAGRRAPGARGAA